MGEEFLRLGETGQLDRLALTAEAADVVYVHSSKELVAFGR